MRNVLFVLNLWFELPCARKKRHCCIWRMIATPFTIPCACVFKSRSISLSPNPVSLIPASRAIPQGNSAKHATLLLENFHQQKSLNALLSRLRKRDSSSLQLLRDYGDWTKDHFWIVVDFLARDSKSNQILELFHMWKNIEKSRINEFNYKKIISLLSAEGLMKEASSALQDMKTHGLKASRETYNLLIHGFANEGNFDNASYFLNEMKELGLARDIGTYDGLIQAYGKYRMYDEIGALVKKMEMDGCSPDHITCNLLIREFSQCGLLKRMEKVYRSMVSRRMNLQSSTLIAMLEAYANFRIIEKMEMVYRKIMKWNIPVKEELIRKMAEVYIENFMFSRLENLGVDLSSVAGNTDLVICMRLLSHACLLSRKGMDSIVAELDEAKHSWKVTFINIILLTYLKMKDFNRLRILLSELPSRNVRPDIVTLGILFDAKERGFHGGGTLETWRRMGFLYKNVEMETDSLVLTSFGKGNFIEKCEKVYSSIQPCVREKKIWSYHDLIELVYNQKP